VKSNLEKIIWALLLIPSVGVVIGAIKSARSSKKTA
jgi:hypothetical protein